MSRTSTISTIRSRHLCPRYKRSRRKAPSPALGDERLTASCRGNLSNKSLAAIVDPLLVIQDSEYLETHLIAVPNTITKEFLKSYETISAMVVPRSAQLIDSDNEFTLYAVTTFKKHSAEFVHKCRESKWTPRDFKYKEGGKEEEQKEVERVGKEERKVWGEALRLGRTAWGEAVMAWVHVLALRVFVETVLRYGLPLQFVCGLIRVCQVPQPFHKAQDSACKPLTSTVDRLRPSWQKKREAHWTFHTHIWRVTPSVVTRKAESLRMILRLRQICKQLGTWAMTEVMQRMFAMNLKFSRIKYLLFRQ